MNTEKDMNAVEFDIRVRCRYPYTYGQRIDYMMPNLEDKRAGIVKFVRSNYVVTMTNSMVCKSLIFDVEGGFGGGHNKD